jgi:hypothetical protein
MFYGDFLIEFFQTLNFVLKKKKKKKRHGSCDGCNSARPFQSNYIVPKTTVTPPAIPTPQFVPQNTPSIFSYQIRRRKLRTSTSTAVAGN